MPSIIYDLNSPIVSHRLKQRYRKLVLDPLSESEQTCEVNEPSRGTMVGFVTPDQVCILCRAPGKPLSQHGTRYAVSKWGDTSAAYTGVQNKWKLYPDSLAPVIK